MSDLFNNSYKSKIVKINSSERKNTNQSSGDFTVNFQNTTEGLRAVLGIQLISISLPHTFYNIYKCNFYYTVNNVDRTLHIPDGQYTIDEFMDKFVTLWNLHESVNMVYTPTNQANPTLHPTTYKLALDFKKQISFTTSTTNKVAQVFGFGHGGVTKTTDANGLISPPYMIDLLQISSVFIHSPELSGGSAHPNLDGLSDLLCVVPLNEPFGSSVYREVKSGSASLIRYDSPRTFTSINIKIKDKNNIVLDTHGTDMSLVLKAYYIP